jgi:signal transduction histidine kinase
MEEWFMSAVAPLDQPVLDSLAPQRLVSHRARRFIGDTVSSSIIDFVAEDRERLQSGYQALLRLLHSLERNKDSGMNGWVEVRQLLEQVGWKQVVKDMQLFGNATVDDHNTHRLEAVIHDIKGGSFVALVINVQLFEMGIAKPTDLLRMFFLTRDHLKMMRNAVPDLDETLYQRDLMQHAHSVRLLVEKWSQAVHKLENAAAQIVLECEFDGNISERCIEFAALDRVLYNLINNAVRHSADNRVYLSIFPLSDEQDQNVRFVIYNQIRPEHQALLRAQFGDQIHQLFKGSFTTGGSGLGMQICADFVADAYGVGSVQRCVEQGYIGARVVDQYFVTWFHWPVAAD